MLLVIKKYAVWIALVLTLAATWWASQQEEDVQVVSVPASRPIKTTLPAQANTQMALTNNEHLVAVNSALPKVGDDAPKNIFTAYTAPATQATAGQNAAPSMPANPYVYAGKIVDGVQVTVFLLNGENGYAVKVGDVLDELWKVKAIKPPHMILRYLPLKTDTQLDIGVVN